MTPVFTEDNLSSVHLHWYRYSLFYSTYALPHALSAKWWLWIVHYFNIILKWKIFIHIIFRKQSIILQMRMWSKTQYLLNNIINIEYNIYQKRWRADIAHVTQHKILEYFIVQYMQTHWSLTQNYSLIQITQDNWRFRVNCKIASTSNTITTNIHSNTNCRHIQWVSTGLSHWTNHRQPAAFRIFE